MRGRNTLIMLLVIPLLSAVAGPSPAMGAGRVSIDPSLWDRAVDSLLAAGMYGIDLSADTDWIIKLQRTEGISLVQAPDLARFSGHAITFSYKGSSGLLGFSAGYIYTSHRTPRSADTIFADMDQQQYSIDPGDDWFMAIDLSGAYRLHDDLAIGLGSRTMLIKNPLDREKGRMLSFLLNIPMSYRNFITITPELQWSHSLSEASLSAADARDGDRQAPVQDIFYGGVSVTFSY
ncbi:MAG TPA: hypothetical protein ENI89_07295 [Desulfobulbus sp.]|nr:hypothetical protein [Desulfobulbus sp.]